MRSLVLRLRQGCDIGVVISWLRLFTDGHQSTCDIISKLLGISLSVPMNRVNYTQKIGDMALIFKLKSRPEEGKILTAEEIEAIGYELGVIERTA